MLKIAKQRPVTIAQLPVKTSLPRHRNQMAAGRALSGIEPSTYALIERLRLLCELLGSVVRAAFLPRSVVSLIAVLSYSLMQ